MQRVGGRRRRGPRLALVYSGLLRIAGNCAKAQPMLMRYAHLLALSAAASAVLIFAASKVDAQSRTYGPRNNFPSQGGGMGRGFDHGFGGVWVVDREVPVII